MINYRQLLTDSTGPTHEGESLGRLALYLICEGQQRVLRKGLVTWGINNRHFGDVYASTKVLAVFQ